MSTPAPLSVRAVRWLFWAALALRLWFVLVAHPAHRFIYSDMQSYHQVALQLLQGQVSPWHAFRPVGYSLLLVPFYALGIGPGWVGVLQALLGAAMVPLAARLATRCRVGPRGALVCALLVACSAPLVMYGGLILTELPSAFLLLLGITFAFEAAPAQRAKWLGAGFALGLAVALRPNLLLALPPLALFTWRRDAAAFAALSLGVALPVLCVSAYNSHALGHLAGPSCNGGLNFYLNFADVHTIQYRGVFGGYWVSPVPNGLDHTRLELTDVPFFDDRHYYRSGIAFVAQQPAALRDALANFVEAAGLGRQLYWPDWPGHGPLLRAYARLFFGLVLLPALLLSFAQLLPNVRKGTAATALQLVAICMASLLPIYFFLGDPRVRVPFDPLWMVLAVLAVQRLATHFGQRSGPSGQTTGEDTSGLP